MSSAETGLTKKLKELMGHDTVDGFLKEHKGVITRQGLYKILNGTNVPTDETLKSLCEAMGAQDKLNELIELAARARDRVLRIAFPMAGWPAILIGMLAEQANFLGKPERQLYDAACFGYVDTNSRLVPTYWSEQVSNGCMVWPGQRRAEPNIKLFTAKECLELLSEGTVDAAIIAHGTYERLGIVRAATIQHSIGNAYLAVVCPDKEQNATVFKLDQVLIPKGTNADMFQAFLWQNDLHEITKESSVGDGPFRDSTLDGWSWDVHESELHKIKGQYISSVFEDRDQRTVVSLGKRKLHIPARVRFVMDSVDHMKVDLGYYSRLESAMLSHSGEGCIAAVLWTPQLAWLARKVVDLKGKTLRCFRPPYFALVKGDTTARTGANVFSMKTGESSRTWTRFDLVFRSSDKKHWYQNNALNAFLNSLDLFAQDAFKSREAYQRTCRSVARFLDIHNSPSNDANDGVASIDSIISNQRFDITMDRGWSGQSD